MQGEKIKDLPERLTKLEYRFNYHGHYAMYADMIEGKHKLPFAATTVITEYCSKHPTIMTKDQECKVPTP